MNMNILNTETRAYRSETAVRAEYSEANVSPPYFPFPPDVRVQDMVQPSFNALTHEVVEGSPELEDGVWRQTWAVVALDAGVIAARLASAQATAWERIKAHRDQLSDTGGYKAGGKWFHSDGKSKTQQLALVMLGANVPPVAWKTMDGSFVTMSQTIAGQVFQAALTQDMALFAAAEAHKSAMQASADSASYDFSAGWPATFA